MFGLKKKAKKQTKISQNKKGWCHCLSGGMGIA
jgi:hypothetical protein